MPEPTRRSFLTVAGATAVTAAAGTLVAPAALAAATAPAPAAPAGAGRAPAGSRTLAYVKDASRGELAVLVGDREVVVVAPAAVAAITSAASAGSR